jgi:2-polyprenyl-6-methoxyphenol hydroxylase-like FAD-dependent oxidoreductase
MDHDVIVVGYGPTGKILARRLSDAGHSVAIVERWPEVYPLPRALVYDHEIKRIFHALGLVAQIDAISRPMSHYVWYSADWKVLADIDEARESLSGGRNAYLANQPDLERVLERDLRGRPGVGFFLGNEAQRVEQTADGASVTIAPFDHQTHEADLSRSVRLTAKYVVGCDGANSIVREALGSTFLDHGFDAQWLVVDVRPHDPSSLQFPDAVQWCSPERPTTIVWGGVVNRRWEFMIKPGEDAAEFSKPEKTWQLLSRWLKPGDGELVRHAVYRFRSALAQGWRNGRLLIAGDAAHLMPPFMGQGMCSGIRDSWSLAWKLDRVLKGSSSDSLLDAYEAERGPNVDAYVRLSMEVGKIVCAPDAEAAKVRDAAFLNGELPPPLEFPGLSGGVIAKGWGAGLLTPHDELATPQGLRRLDDITGGGFALIGDLATIEALDSRSRATADKLGVVLVAIGAGAHHEQSGRVAAWLATHKAAAVLVRPDFYAFGLARDAAQAGQLLIELAAKLAR